MLMQRQRIAQVTASPAGSAPAGALPRSERIQVSLFMKSSAINNAIAFSLNITAYARHKATQKNTRGHSERPRTAHTIPTRTQKVQANAPVNKGLCHCCFPCACALVQVFEETALFPPLGEKQPRKGKYSANSRCATPPHTPQPQSATLKKQ